MREAIRQKLRLKIVFPALHDIEDLPAQSQHREISSELRDLVPKMARPAQNYPPSNLDLSMA